MSSIPSIQVSIRRSDLDADGHYRMVSVRHIMLSAELGNHVRKYLPDIIMHALTLSPGMENRNHAFTYTFPFNLS